MSHRIRTKKEARGIMMSSFASQFDVLSSLDRQRLEIVQAAIKEVESLESQKQEVEEKLREELEKFEAKIEREIEEKQEKLQEKIDHLEEFKLGNKFDAIGKRYATIVEQIKDSKDEKVLDVLDQYEEVMFIDALWNVKDLDDLKTEIEYNLTAIKNINSKLK
jgi:septal ring factor EnvC (AmiA/AmiB activator)